MTDYPGAEDLFNEAAFSGDKLWMLPLAPTLEEIVFAVSTLSQEMFEEAHEIEEDARPWDDLDSNDAYIEYTYLTEMLDYYLAMHREIFEPLGRFFFHDLRTAIDAHDRAGLRNLANTICNWAGEDTSETVAS